MLHMQCFVRIGLSCLILVYANALYWYENRANRQTDMSYGNRIIHRNSNRYCECGKKNIFPSSSRIIGGREVSENEFPWMAGIISVNKPLLICGASIINDRYVVTAAHCISFDFSKNDMKVSVGLHNSCKWDLKSTIFSIENIFPHPNYNRQTNFADIMLVKLVMRITFNEFVRPICLPKIGHDIVFHFGGRSVSALGWGFSENDSLFDDKCGLRIVDLTLFQRSKCFTNISTLICAGDRITPRGTCGGDSGGPLQLLDDDKYVLIGITSNGLICADVNSPDFYTDVAQLIPWIQKVTNNDSTYCRH